MLAARATVDGVTTPFPVLLDTGSPVTALDDVALGIAPAGAAPLRARIGGLRVWSDVDPPVPRLQLNDVQLFLAPLAPVGIGADLFAPNGVVGGDNLGRFAVELDPRAPSPLVRLLPSVTTCSCDLADACQAVFGVALGGGAQSIAIGDTLYPYPATRVIIDACLEPLPDPVSRDEACVDKPGGPLHPPYQPSGVDVRLVIATGFPGLALASGVYDRLRGAGAAATARAQAPVEVRFPGRGAVEAAGRVSLGGGAASALALVSREIFFGPCAELARSRRIRRYPPEAAIPEGEPLARERTCTDAQTDPSYLSCCDRVGSCKAKGSSSICDDSDGAARAAAVVELAGPVDAVVLGEGTPFLSAVNEDLRPSISTANPPPVVEGVVGMEVLGRLVATLDYPGKRLIARCADGAPGCLAYPRFSNESECDRACTPAKALYVSGYAPTSGMLGGLCPPAPGRQ